MKKYLICGFIAMALFSTRSSLAQKPSDFGLKEGDLISAIFSDDPDVYIINNQGYKRLFLNPEIFKFYGHLGGFFNVKLVTKEVVDAFPTSGLFRDCESNDQKVYGVDISGEDIGKLHWVNTSGDQAVKDDPDFFKKVFCINSAEFNWYPKGNALETVKNIPNYERTSTNSKVPTEMVTVNSSLKKVGQVVICHYPQGSPSQANTITINASAVKTHLAQGDTIGQCLITNSVPIISGVSGPQTLSVGEQGTWTVKASDPSGGNLSYSVVWGDEGYAVPTANSIGQYPRYQSATLTHTYSQAGNYTPSFTVTNTSGQSAQASLSVNVGSVTSGSVTVLSPNGGETWSKGTIEPIRWQDNVKSLLYDIKLVQYLPPCTGNICPMYYPMPYTLAEKVSGFSYNWSVGKILDVNRTVLDGSYTIEVCQSGTSVCDSSDSYFKITTVVSPLTITTSSPLPNARVGINYSASIYASGGTGDYNWQISSGSLPLGISFLQSQCSTYPCAREAFFSGTPTFAGTYLFTIQVNDGGMVIRNKQFILTVDPISFF